MKLERVLDAARERVPIVEHRERADQAGVAEHLRLDIRANPRRRRRDVNVLGRELILRMSGDRRARCAATR